jgi:flagellar hook-associated protein 1 FlgK
MSLMSAMNASISGLRTMQMGIDAVGQNVANADSVGYTRRRLSTVQAVAGDQTTGVRANALQRTLDVILQRQLRLETGGAAYTGVKSNTHAALDRLFGSPGGVGSLDTVMNGLRNSLQQLATDPASYSTRSGALQAARTLAGQLNATSQGIQTLRRDAEAGIASGVSEVNRLLGELGQINAKVAASGQDTPSAALLDERDRIINDLSHFMDIRVTERERGTVTVFTTAGLQLFDGTAPVKLTFDQRSAISPASVWDPVDANRGVGTIRAVDSSGGSVDVIASKLIRSGEIAAYIDLRDDVLVEAQRQVDELAANLAQSLSDREIAGTAATAGAATGFDIDIAGMQPGNVVTLDAVLMPAGTTRRFSFVRVDDPSQLPLPATATADPSDTVVGINFTGGTASVATQIQAALGAGYAVSNPAGTTLRILDDGAAGTTNVTGLRANATVTTTASGNPALALFVDGGFANTPFSGAFIGGSRLTGFSQRIAVNPDLVANPAGLVVYQGAPIPTPQGDATRPTFLLDRLTASQRLLSPQTGIGGAQAAYSGSIIDMANRIIETQGANAQSAARLDEGQKVVLSTVEGRFAETAGVNVDEEMAQLIRLQTAYAANARIITAAKELMDVLLRV